MDTTCRWCGSDCIDDTDEHGFWCGDCDGYTYFDEKQDSRRLLLLLEDRENSHQMEPFTKTSLHKRLSPLRYPGGKSKVIDQIYARLIPEKLETFVELFAGGASLGLSLLDAGKIKNLILNDLAPLVHNFWNVVLREPEVLIRYIRNDLPDMDRYWRAKANIKEAYPAEGQPDADLAYDFLLLNRLSFGGILSANPICGRNGSDEDLRQRWNPESLVKRIEHIVGMRDHITLYRQSAESLFLEQIGWYPERTTIFVDPPYTTAGKLLYGMTFQDGHRDLADALNEFFRCWPGPDIIITYDDSPMVRELYPYATVEKLQTCWSIRR